jgi:hypothetical protein
MLTLLRGQRRGRGLIWFETRANTIAGYLQLAQVLKICLKLNMFFVNFISCALIILLGGFSRCAPMGTRSFFQKSFFQIFVQNSLTNPLEAPGVKFLNFSLLSYPDPT